MAKQKFVKLPVPAGEHILVNTEMLGMVGPVSDKKMALYLRGAPTGITIMMSLEDFTEQFNLDVLVADDKFYNQTAVPVEKKGESLLVTD